MRFQIPLKYKVEFAKLYTYHFLFLRTNILFRVWEYAEFVVYPFFNAVTFCQFRNVFEQKFWDGKFNAGTASAISF